MVFRIFILSIIVMLLSGCATWRGIKKDTSYAWKETKKTVHDATAD